MCEWGRISVVLCVNFLSGIHRNFLECVSVTVLTCLCASVCARVCVCVLGRSSLVLTSIQAYGLNSLPHKACNCQKLPCAHLFVCVFSWFIMTEQTKNTDMHAHTHAQSNAAV